MNENMRRGLALPSLFAALTLAFAPLALAAPATPATPTGDISQHMYDHDLSAQRVVLIDLAGAPYAASGGGGGGTVDQGAKGSTAQAWYVEVATGGAVVGTGNPLVVGDGGGALTVDSAQLPAALAAGGGLKIEGVAGGVQVSVGDGTGPLTVDGSVSVSALPAGTIAAGTTGAAGTPSATVVSIQGVAGGTAIPVSGTVTATIDTTGLATEAEQLVQSNWLNLIKTNTDGPLATETEQLVQSELLNDIKTNTTGPLATETEQLVQSALLNDIKTNTTGPLATETEQLVQSALLNDIKTNTASVAVGTLPSVDQGSRGTTGQAWYVEPVTGGAVVDGSNPLPVSSAQPVITTIASASVSVGTTATLLTAGMTGAHDILIKPLSTAARSVFVGDATVTTSTGIELLPGETLPSRIGTTSPLYAIVATGTVDVRVLGSQE